MLHIYLRTNTTLIHNSLYVFDDCGGGDLSRKYMQCNYSKKMFTERVKPFRIIGYPDNQRPDKWSSTILTQNRASVTGLLRISCIS